MEDLAFRIIEHSLQRAQLLKTLQERCHSTLLELQMTHIRQRADRRPFDSIEYFVVFRRKLEDSMMRCKQVEKTERAQFQSVDALKSLVQHTTDTINRAEKRELNRVGEAIFPLLESLIQCLNNDAFSIESNKLGELLARHVAQPIFRVVQSTWQTLFTTSAKDVVVSLENCLCEKQRLETALHFQESSAITAKVM